MICRLIISVANSRKCCGDALTRYCVFFAACLFLALPDVYKQVSLCLVLSKSPIEHYMSKACVTGVGTGAGHCHAARHTNECQKFLTEFLSSAIAFIMLKVVIITLLYTVGSRLADHSGRAV